MLFQVSCQNSVSQFDFNIFITVAVEAFTPNGTEYHAQFTKLQVQPARTGEVAFLKCYEPTNWKNDAPRGSRWKFGKRLIMEVLGIREYITPELKGESKNIVCF